MVKPATKEKPKRTSNKTAVWIVSGVFALIIGFSLWWFFGGGSALLEQHKMKAYLEEKYGKEFVVENYRIQGSGLGVEGEPHADAYPKDQPSLLFDVRGNKLYSDRYADVTWEQEERKRLDTPLSQVLGYRPNYTLEIHAILASAADKDINKDNFPSFDEAAQRYKNDISYALTVNSNSTYSTLNKEEFAKQYLEIARIIVDKGKDPVLNYSIRLDNGKYYGLTMSAEEYNKLHNPSDLMDSFKEWGVAR